MYRVPVMPTTPVMIIKTTYRPGPSFLIRLSLISLLQAYYSPSRHSHSSSDSPYLGLRTQKHIDLGNYDDPASCPSVRGRRGGNSVVRKSPCPSFPSLLARQKIDARVSAIWCLWGGTRKTEGYSLFDSIGRNLGTIPCRT